LTADASELRPGTTETLVKGKPVAVDTLTLNGLELVVSGTYVRTARVADDFLGRAFFDDDSAIHEDDAVRDIAGEADLVSDDDHRHAGVGKSEMIILSVPDSLLKGANNEKLVRHVRTLNPTAKIVATADLLSDVADLYAAGADYVTVTRLTDAHELYTVIEAADAGLLEDKRAEMDVQLAERKEVLP